MARRRQWMLIIGVFVVALVITVLRLGPDRFAFALWEDGWKWPLQGLTVPGGAILHPYAGYLHVIPRLGALALLNFLPPEGYAIGVTILACVLEALVAAAVFWLARDLVPMVVPRIALALLPAVLPIARSEVMGTLSNLHSYLIFLAFWILIARHRSWRAAWVWAFVLLLAVLSSPEAPLLFLLIPWILLRRDRRAWPLVGALVVGEILQFVLGVLSNYPRKDIPMEPWSLIQGWVINTVLPVVNGQAQWQQSLFVSPAQLWTLPTLVAGVFVLLLAFILVKGTAEQRLLGLALFFGSIALYVGYASSNGSAPLDYATMSRDTLLSTAYFNTRYGFSTGVFLAALIPLFASVVGTMRGRPVPTDAVAKSGRWSGLLESLRSPQPVDDRPAAGFRPLRLTITGLAVVAIALMLVHSSPPSFTPDPSIAWAAQVEKARAECLDTDLPLEEVLIGPPAEGLLQPVPCSFLER